ncbi:IclR family transcriptional regulator [Sciscionella marina]|uniref:IclR family transcriptional regulator n=1 Tax=Sciscionella marina TaxID=508770 RepID=UPI00036A373F|nr:IclR family transcriptional regulator [Sciscionella marina]
MRRAVNNPDDGQPVRGSVDKALDLLAALASGDGPHRLAELARETGIAKPTVHRMLRTMAESGFAVGTEGGAYHVGPRFLGMAAAALAGSRGNQFARPVLEELQRRTGHTVHYAVRHGGEAIYVDKVEPAQSYRMTSRVGGQIPLYCTAVGRAILARLPERERAEVLGTAPLPARTEYTLTDPDAIRAALAEWDERGFLTEDRQNEPDIRCVAAPVIDGLGAVIGAISVSGLVFTLDEESIEVYGPMVRAAADEVSATLGGQGPRLSSVRS